MRYLALLVALSLPASAFAAEECLRFSNVGNALNLKYAVLEKDSGLTVRLDGPNVCVTDPGFDLGTVRSSLTEAQRATASAAAQTELDARRAREATDIAAARIILASGAPATWTDTQKDSALKMCLESLVDPVR